MSALRQTPTGSKRPTRSAGSAHNGRGGIGRLVLAACIALAPLAVANSQNGSGVTIEQLQQELARRDAVIVELLNRVRALEDGRDADIGEPIRVTSAGNAREPVFDAEAADSSVPEDDVQIDALLAERALERGLVQEGARLLPRGQIEIAPEVFVSHDSGMFPTALMLGADAVVGEVKRTFDVYDTRASLRYGLPREFQLNVGIPMRFVRQEIETSIDGAPESAATDSGSGIGDIAIGMSKVLANNESSGASLIGELTWLSGTGDARDGDVYLGGGNSGASARLSASWRRDPLIFLLSGGYTYFDEEGPLQFGNSLDLSLGLGFAVSPETALILSLNQSSVSELRRDGVVLPGTDRLASTLNLSASTTLGRRLFMRTDAGIGLTDDATDFRLGVTFSSRLNVR